MSKEANLVNSCRRLKWPRDHICKEGKLVNHQEKSVCSFNEFMQWCLVEIIPDMLSY